MELIHNNPMTFQTPPLSGARTKGTSMNTTITDSGFDDLEALLATAMAEKAEKNKGAELRAKLAKGKKTLSADEVDEINAAIARWEAEQLWRPLATVGVFEKQTCKCGHSALVYSYHLQLQEYRTKPDTRRYTRAEYDAKLPRLSRVLDVSVDFCHHCVTTVFNPAELEEFDAPLSAIDLQ